MSHPADNDAPLTHFFDPRVGGMLHAIAPGFGTLNGTDNAAKVDCATCLSLINAEDARTHGREHAPLPEGTLLAPGYCAGCDSERVTPPAKTEGDR